MKDKENPTWIAGFNMSFSGSSMLKWKGLAKGKVSTENRIRSL
jgi:hypothetical protein